MIGFGQNECVFYFGKNHLKSTIDSISYLMSGKMTLSIIKTRIRKVIETREEITLFF